MQQCSPTSSLAGGQWVVDAARTLESRPYTNDSCPLAGPQYFMCHGKQGKHSRNRVYQPPQCNLVQPNSSLLFRLLGHWNVVFRGDSVSREHFVALACTLQPFWQNHTATWSTTANAHLPIITHACVNLLPPSGGSICFGKDTKHKSVKPKTLIISGILAGVQWGYAMGHEPLKRAELHNATLEGYFVESWRRAVKAERDYLAALGRLGALVVYREASPQHFACDSSFDEPCFGYFVTRQRRSPLNATTDWERSARIKGGAAPSSDLGRCATGWSSMPTLVRLERELIAPLVQSSHWLLAYLPTFDVSQYAGSMHREEHDCVHWCLPGVPDEWTAVLATYLLQLEAAPNGSKLSLGVGRAKSV